MADIAAALKRVEKVLRRSPQTGLHADAPATARWDGGTRVVCNHANGTELTTDMPTELGGAGSAVTPGWLMRAGLAACVSTRIAMAAATAGIELSALEVVASSRSDTRGLLEMPGIDGEPVGAGPSDVQLHVKISAGDATSVESLRSLVERCNRSSPIFCAIQQATPIELRVEVGGG